VLTIAIVCLSSLSLPNSAVAQTDQAAAQQILGPQWRQLSRRAGMIFAGTVLASANQPTTTEQSRLGATQSIQLRFRVDCAITGVVVGQILTIHEWAGAWSMDRPPLRGQHILIFLYPPSRLGLTSPVGGALGQVGLDASGRMVAERRSAANVNAIRDSFQQPRVIGAARTVSVIQLERAIRDARSE
jgi:hypothetical protein